MSYGGQCVYCGNEVSAENAAYQVKGLEFTREQGGANVIRGRERVKDWIAHQPCAERELEKRRKGIPPEQPPLL